MFSKKIAVLYGGLSDEREVSLKTGSAVFNAMQKLGWENSYLLDVDDGIAEKLLSNRPDLCFLALHGKYGEDGTIQGLLEIMHIPYTGSKVAASAAAFDKVLSKLIFIGADITTPEYKIFNESMTEPPFFPCVVKPAREGSTIGITIVKDKEEYSDAVINALSHDEKVIIEEFIDGKELTVSIIDDEILPPIWIRPKKGFYDYESKYTKGMTEYLFETGLSSEEEESVKEIAKKAYDALGCTSAARVDMICDNNKCYVLEVNTLPGMTETSLLPNAARKAGITFEALVKKIVAREIVA